MAQPVFAPRGPFQVSDHVQNLEHRLAMLITEFGKHQPVLLALQQEYIKLRRDLTTEVSKNQPILLALQQEHVELRKEFGTLWDTVEQLRSGARVLINDAQEGLRLSLVRTTRQTEENTSHLEALRSTFGSQVSGLQSSLDNLPNTITSYTSEKMDELTKKINRQLENTLRDTLQDQITKEMSVHATKHSELLNRLMETQATLERDSSTRQFAIAGREGELDTVLHGTLDTSFKEVLAKLQCHIDECISAGMSTLTSMINEAPADGSPARVTRQNPRRQAKRFRTR